MPCFCFFDYSFFHLSGSNPRLRARVWHERFVRPRCARADQQRHWCQGAAGAFGTTESRGACALCTCGRTGSLTALLRTPSQRMAEPPRRRTVLTSRWMAVQVDVSSSARPVKSAGQLPNGKVRMSGGLRMPPHSFVAGTDMGRAAAGWPSTAASGGKQRCLAGRAPCRPRRIPRSCPLEERGRATQTCCSRACEGGKGC